MPPKAARKKRIKTCAICKQDFPATPEHFYQLKSGSLFSYCRGCESSRKRSRWKAKKKRKKKRKKRQKKAEQPAPVEEKKPLKHHANIEPDAAVLHKLYSSKSKKDTLRYIKHLAVILRSAANELRLVVAGVHEPEIAVNRIEDVLDAVLEIEKALTGTNEPQPKEEDLDTPQPELILGEGEL